MNFFGDFSRGDAADRLHTVFKNFRVCLHIFGIAPRFSRLKLWVLSMHLKLTNWGAKWWGWSRAHQSNFRGWQTDGRCRFKMVKKLARGPRAGRQEGQRILWLKISLSLWDSNLTCRPTNEISTWSWRWTLSIDTTFINFWWLFSRKLWIFFRTARHTSFRVSCLSLSNERLKQIDENFPTKDFEDLNTN